MWRPSCVLAVGAVITAACHRTVQINPSQTVSQTARWNATLATPATLSGAVQVKGTAWMAPPNPSDSGRTLASIAISNATSGGLHPWSVHQGLCGSDQGVLGAATAYPLLRVNSDGTASGHTTLSVPVPTYGEYYVVVQASPSNTTTVIACGNFAAPSK